MRHYVTFVLKSMNIIQQLVNYSILSPPFFLEGGGVKNTNFVSQSGENLIVLHSYMRKY